MTERTYLHIGGIRSVEAFQQSLGELNISIPCDNELITGQASPLAQPLLCNEFKVGNRFAIQLLSG